MIVDDNQDRSIRVSNVLDKKEDGWLKYRKADARDGIKIYIGAIGRYLFKIFIIDVI